MKKLICLVLVCLMAFSICGCSGSKTVNAPSAATMKQDIQDYIKEMIDPSAVIDIFENTETKEDGNKITAECTALFTGSAGQQKGLFTLTYVMGLDDWILDKCRVRLEENGTPAKTEAPTETEPLPETTGAPATEAPTEAPTAAPTEAPTEAPAQASGLSDDWKDFTFELSGHTYTLPARYSEFVANGWTIDQTYGNVKEDSEISANSYASIYLTNGAVRFNAQLVNMSGNVRAAADCDIGEIDVRAQNNLGLKLAKGITILSTVDEVKAAYGMPESMSSYEDYDTLRYSVGSYNYMNFYIYKTRTTSNSVTLKNFVATERDNTEVSDERPAYLDTYRPPEKLGSDVKATVFELDGVVCQLPCPMDVFLNNGWEVKSDSIGYLGAGNKNTGITLKKGDLILYIGIKNFSKTAQYSKDCAVYYVDFNHKYFPDDEHLKLPGGRTLSSTEEEVMETYKDFDLYESTSSYYKTLTYETKDYNLRVKYILSEYGNEFQMENRTWSYQ